MQPRRGYQRFIVSHVVWLYYRFNLSHRDIEDLLAERGITVSREAIRLWCIKFGAIYTRRLKRKHRGFGDTFYIDEVFAGVPDHSDQREAGLPVASCGSGRKSMRIIGPSNPMKLPGPGSGGLGD